MKNLKQMFAWITLAVILTVGTVGANAGIIYTGSPQCTDTKGGFVEAITGIIYTGAPQFAGIIYTGAPQFAGIIYTGAPQPCGN